jgi:glycerol uptake facilitator-like aquaporin
LVWCLAHLSGANLNPAVTIALLVTGESNVVHAAFYILAQMFGATMGALVLKEITPDHINTVQNILVQASNTNSNSSISKRQSVGEQAILSALLTTNAKDSALADPLKTSAIEANFVNPIQIGVTLLHEDLSQAQGFGIEVIVTFILMMAVFACLDAKRKDLNGSFPLTIGLAVTVGGLFAGPFTGGSMNPARSFGPALVMNNWTGHWIYWVRSWVFFHRISQIYIFRF